jgi:glycosyltransferase involved in cell wall biosynthesis
MRLWLARRRDRASGDGFGLAKDPYLRPPSRHDTQRSGMALARQRARNFTCRDSSSSLKLILAARGLDPQKGFVHLIRAFDQFRGVVKIGGLVILGERPERAALESRACAHWGGSDASSFPSA